MEHISSETVETLNNIINIATWIIPVMFSIIPHEIAHGYTAYLLGDNTAKEAGRLSFNPFKHIDLYGTIILPLFLMIADVGFVFGYAKPVPVNFYKLKNIRLGLILVAFAGPLMNFILALLFIFFMYYIKSFGDNENIVHLFLYNSFSKAVLLNLVLGLFNLIPLPPLDGGKIAMGLLPKEIAEKYAKLDGRKGMIILIILFMLPNILGEEYDIIGKILAFFMKQILSLPFLANV